MMLIALMGSLLIQDDRAQAETVLETIAAVLKDASAVAFECESRSGTDTGSMRFRFKRPNLVREEMGGGRRVTVIRDGTAMWVHFPDSNEYTKFPQAGLRPTLDSLLEVLFFEKNWRERLDDVADIRVTKEGELRALSWKSESVEWRHWVDAKGALLRSRQTSPQGVVETTYGPVDLRPKLAEDTFTFVPPKGAREIPTYEAGLLPVGWLAPDFQVTDLEGKTVRLSDFKGKTVLLNFWFLG